MAGKPVSLSIRYGGGNGVWTTPTAKLVALDAFFGGGGLALSQSARPDNAATFYSHTLTTGAVTLTQASLFTNSNALAYQHTVQQSQVLAQAARFDGTQAYYTHQLNLKLAQATRFDAAATFYTHALTQGQSLVQSVRFDSAPSFYAHDIELGLSQAVRFDGQPTYFQHNVVAVLAQTARFDSSASFFAHAVQNGNFLFQIQRFDDADAFYQATLVLRLAQTQRLQNSQTFYAHGLIYDQALAQYFGWANANAFFAHEVFPTVAQQLVQVTRYDNVPQYFWHDGPGEEQLDSGGPDGFMPPRTRKWLKERELLARARNAEPVAAKPIVVPTVETVIASVAAKSKVQAKIAKPEAVASKAPDTAAELEAAVIASKRWKAVAIAMAVLDD